MSGAKSILSRFFNQQSSRACYPSLNAWGNCHGTGRWRSIQLTGRGRERRRVARIAKPVSHRPVEGIDGFAVTSAWSWSSSRFRLICDASNPHHTARHPARSFVILLVLASVDGDSPHPFRHPRYADELVLLEIFLFDTELLLRRRHCEISQIIKRQLAHRYISLSLSRKCNKCRVDRFFSYGKDTVFTHPHHILIYVDWANNVHESRVRFRPCFNL